MDIVAKPIGWECDVTIDWPNEEERFFTAMPDLISTRECVIVVKKDGYLTQHQHISGVSNLFIPIAIAALIVLNTMMGSVSHT